ncbi:MAG: hypothetical protein A2017_07350 [Lentisphaerae bacterium GWF2_44_16]|nr:MAG: hypothetical protein A2017_07350 [Lentisphaerae bacterium GWF2_44_16]
MKKKIFTLTELLIVIAIIMLLTSILLPSLQRTREKSKEITCLSNLRQCSLSMQFYSNDFNGWLPITTMTVGGTEYTWLKFLFDNDYVKNYSFARCLSQTYKSPILLKPNGGSLYEIYGTRYELGSSTNRYFNSKNINRESSVIILSDTIHLFTAKDGVTYYWR